MEISKQPKKTELIRPNKMDKKVEVKDFSVDDYVTIQKDGTPKLEIPAFLSRKERDKIIEKFTGDNETFKIIDADGDKWSCNGNEESMTGKFAEHGRYETAISRSVAKDNFKMTLNNVGVGLGVATVGVGVIAGLGHVIGGTGVVLVAGVGLALSMLAAGS